MVVLRKLREIPYRSAFLTVLYPYIVGGYVNKINGRDSHVILRLRADLTLTGLCMLDS